MRTFGKMLKTAVIFCVVMMGLCSFLYPMALTGVSQLTMKEKANGSLINKNGDPVSSAEEAVGSELLGQAFTEDYYFRGRVSSINYNTYTEEQKENGYGNSNPDLKARVKEDLEAFLESHPGVKKEEIPSDLLTASGSGLDPHISPEAARIQITAVARNSGLSEEKVKEIVEGNTEHKFLGIFGEERVNVLKCNLEVARAMGLI